METATEIRFNPATIKAAREACGFSQTEAAALLGISKQLLSGYERGEWEPKPTMLLRICALYNLNDVRGLQTPAP